MKKINSFYHLPTPDFPLGVSYYSPLQINPNAHNIQSNQNLAITLLQEGEVEIHIHGVTHNLHKGDIFIIPPHQLHTFRTVTLETRYIYLSINSQFLALPQTHFFHRDFVEPLFKGQLRVPERIRPTDPLYPILSAPLQVLDRQKEGSPEYSAQLFAAVVSFCAALMPHCTPLTPKEQADSGTQNTIITCISYIKQHYSQRITLQEIADHVHLHPNYLCALFKEHTGKTIFSFLEELRIRQAARLLRSTTLPISRIAEQCGFNSVSFFSRKYRAQLGYSPLQYRKQYASVLQQEADEELPL